MGKQDLSEELRAKLGRVPERPGVYLFKNAKGRVIYVGKAKVLRNRVMQYFQDSRGRDPKTEALVAEIADLDLIATDNELEALILESSLIKTEKPRYNVLLRDDKDWLYLRLTVSEPFPRLLPVRRPQKDGSLLFGPYIPAYLARRLKATIHKYFGIRTCSRDITGSDPRACLQHDMGRCPAPCISKAVWDEYGENARKARLLLEGKNKELIEELRRAMFRAGERQEYEKAAGYRDALAVVQQQSDEQRIAGAGFEEQDIFAHRIEGRRAVMVMFAVRAGLVRSKKEFAWDFMGEEDGGELPATAIQQFYHGISYVPKTIIVQEDFAGRELMQEWLSGLRGSKVEIVVPLRGKKKNLLELALDNAELAWKNRFTLTELESLQALQDALDLPVLPARIECFDISSIQGSDQVAGMVVWIEGKPRKSCYRKFKIKGFEGQDDFASMREAVRRRYARQVREGKPPPDLVLIDGGKGQLSAAREALEATGLGDLPVVAIAKKEEIIFAPWRDEGIRLGAGDPALKLAQRIRDEAHRFAVAFHRSLRGERTLSTALRRIPGIGPKRAKKLLIKFGSIERVRRAGDGQLAEVIGRQATARLREYLEDNNMEGAPNSK